MAASNYIWKRSPFLRVLLPFVTGIIIQWYNQFSLEWWLLPAIVSCLALSMFSLLPFFHRYKLSLAIGIFIFILFCSIGAIVTFQKDIRHSKQWFGNFYSDSCSVVVTITDPPSVRTKSIKAQADILYLIKSKRLQPVKGKIILYFKKNIPLVPVYGSRLVFKKSLSEIKNTGNPGAFDYRRYSLFQGISHQVYLSTGDFEILQGKSRTLLNTFLFTIREWILSIIRINISDEKQAGLAEALLIGYKDDLDRELVQSYSNTGVVHIIAISGLHLGIIYWLLVLLFRPLSQRKRIKWLPPFLIIISLWLFSLLAGGQPSVIRSALMFTCILLAELFSRKSTIYNSLALSAFVLLCWNPYWLWDLGFQLSYAAVLSLVLFMRPIYNLFFFKNKIADWIWQLNAVTLSAQVLTFPFCVYYFHQFPAYFLLTNLLAVPLSSIILIVEILLCLVYFIHPVSLFIGKMLGWMIWLMNESITKIESLPFSTWNNLQLNDTQLILLLICISGCSYWLAQRSAGGLKTGLFALLLISAIRATSFKQASQQQKMIIYNITGKKAIDFIDGRTCYFMEDSSLTEDEITRNFHIRPSHILQRIHPGRQSQGIYYPGIYLEWHGIHILFTGKILAYPRPIPIRPKEIIDVVILSNNTRVSISKLASFTIVRQVVADGSAPDWRKKYWKRDCDSLHIPWHDVTLNGAFVMSLR